MRVRVRAAIFLALLSPLLMAPTPTEWPIGTYVHTLQNDRFKDSSPAIRGWDPVENRTWNGAGNSTAQQNKDALTNSVKLYPVGLRGGIQPAALARKTPGGTCPTGSGNLNTTNLSHITETVDFPGGPQDVKIVRDCHFGAAFGGDDGEFNVDHTTNGLNVVIINSFIPGQLRSEQSSGTVFVFDSVIDGGNGVQGALYCGDSSSCYISHSDVLGGSDVVKMGSNDTIAYSHFHGYQNYGPFQPHFDCFQNGGDAFDNFVIGNNIDCMFRDSQNPYRGTSNNSAGGDVILYGNLMSGGHKGNGNAVGHINGPQGFTGYAAFWANTVLGSALNTIGISWHLGSAFTCGSGVPNGSCYAEGNVASDGNTSGSSGNSDGGADGNDVWNQTWNSGASAAVGSVVTTVPSGVKTATEDRQAEVAAFRAAALSAAGYGPIPFAYIVQVTPRDPVAGQDVVLQYAVQDLGAIDDLDVTLSGANSGTVDFNSPFTGTVTIPGSYLSEDGATAFTITVDGATADTESDPRTLTFTDAAPIYLAVDPGATRDESPVSFQVKGTVMGGSGAALVLLDHDGDGVYDYDVTPSGTSGDLHFEFDPDDEKAGPFTHPGAAYAVRAWRGGQMVEEWFAVVPIPADHWTESGFPTETYNPDDEDERGIVMSFDENDCPGTAPFEFRFERFSDGNTTTPTEVLDWQSQDTWLDTEVTEHLYQRQNYKAHCREEGTTTPVVSTDFYPPTSGGMSYSSPPFPGVIAGMPTALPGRVMRVQTWSGTTFDPDGHWWVWETSTPWRNRFCGGEQSVTLGWSEADWSKDTNCSPWTTTTHMDFGPEGIEAGQTYCYRVQTADAEGVPTTLSDWSGFAGAGPDDVPPNNKAACREAIE